MFSKCPNWRRDCLVVLPSLNEEVGLASLIQRIAAFLPSVLVVDDASTDGTSDVARGAGSEVLRLPEHLGKGGALKAGWEWGRERGYAWVLCMDADGQHCPDDIPKFFESAEQSGAVMVSGMRDFGPGSMPAMRSIANAWMSRCLSRLAGAELPDTQCGFRLLHLPSLLSFEIQSRQFQIESEVLMRMLRRGFRVAWVPVRTLYQGRPSHISPFRDGWRWFRWYFEARREWKGSGRVQMMDGSGIAREASVAPPS